MAVTVTLPPTSGFTASDMFSVIDYLTTEASFSGFSPTLITGSGTFDGSSVSFAFEGTGFALGYIGLDIYVTEGTLQTVSFNPWEAGTGTITFENVNIDMAEFTPIIVSDVSGESLFAIESFMMDLNWDIRLGDADDVAPKGTLTGDGLALNMTGNDVIRGMGGNDDLFSGDGRDKLFGNSGRDILDGGKGGDVIRGGNGNDRLLGDQGRDKLFGEKGRDTLKGGSQNDVLDGGSGRDVLFGGGGADRFVFKDGSGRDKIMDFNATNNREDIDLRQLSTINSFKSLKNNFMEQQDNDVIINDGAGVKITLVGVDIDDLGRGDFLF